MLLYILAGLLLVPRVLILTGQNNHDWERTVAHLEAILNEGDYFEVNTVLTPAQDASWEGFDVDFSLYDVVVSAYNGEQWPEDLRRSFEMYVAEGGTVVMQHAANNPFPGWKAFEQMVGLLWRGPDGGDRVFVDNDGELVRVPAGDGIGAGHGRLHDWSITTRAPEHPIFRGFPTEWLHPYDELYHGQRGPAENLHVLATAYSSPEHGGTGKHELMVWWIPYGEGKVLTLLPGHLWAGQEDDRALRCVGFRTLLARSVQWLALGVVTLPLPEDFPTLDQTRIR